MGRAVFAKLARQRRHDPGALISFFRLTVGVQWSALAAVALTLVLDRGVSSGSIGLALPNWPAGAGPVLISASIGLAAAVAAGIVLGVRGARSGTGLPVAPESIAPMIPVTRTERYWAAAVAVGAGASEELVFRGLLLAVAVGLGLHPVLAAAVLTVVFGAAHRYQGVGGVVTTTVFGAVMSAIALGTQSLLLPIVLHAALDLRALLLTRPAVAPAWHGEGRATGPDRPAPE
ncbi:CPBP family intramembrane glutamic endopeptidase [Pseudonocardia sp. GCM10023141]|uniref:CPBP family intramembrane glutamic endopeptidase n=1 Tax=Pseudonocardia sp. GCM10023141 TaxID=3252653 RepID=UPI00360DF16F